MYLINFWPVIYVNADETSMFTYQLGGYLVPALIGKIFDSFAIAEVVQYIWLVLGTLLVYIHLIKITKSNTIKGKIVCLFMMLFFTAFTVIDRLLVQQFFPEMYNPANGWIALSVESGGIRLQFLCFIMQEMFLAKSHLQVA